MSNQSFAETATYTTQQTQDRNIHTLKEIRTCDPSNQRTPDLNLRPRGHRDRTDIFVCVRVCIYVCSMYVCVYVCMYVYMYVYMYVCLYIYIYTHTHIRVHTYIQCTRYKAYVEWICLALSSVAASCVYCEQNVYTSSSVEDEKSFRNCYILTEDPVQ
jgi:hypothetical protein